MCLLTGEEETISEGKLQQRGSRLCDGSLEMKLPPSRVRGISFEELPSIGRNVRMEDTRESII